MQRQQLDAFVVQFRIVGQRWLIQSVGWDSRCLPEKVLDLIFTAICLDCSVLHYANDKNFGFDQASPLTRFCQGFGFDQVVCSSWDLIIIESSYWC